MLCGSRKSGLQCVIPGTVMWLGICRHCFSALWLRWSVWHLPGNILSLELVTTYVHRFVTFFLLVLICSAKQRNSDTRKGGLFATWEKTAQWFGHALPRGLLLSLLAVPPASLLSPTSSRPPCLLPFESVKTTMRGCLRKALRRGFSSLGHPCATCRIYQPLLGIFLQNRLGFFGGRGVGRRAGKWNFIGFPREYYRS